MSEELKTLKCPSCNANFNGVECEFCGTKIAPPPPPKPKSFMDNFMGTFMEGLQKQMETQSSAFPDIMQNSPNIDYKTLYERGEAEQQEAQKALKEKNRLARIAISKQECPECGTKFKTVMGFATSNHCLKCGALINASMLVP